MRYEWLSLEQASRHLGVSVRTLRRWIHSGKLSAELRPGPYGKQYLVPLQGLDSVEIVRDVERAERQEEREAIPKVVESYLERRESALASTMESLAAELRETVSRLEAQQDAILAELRTIRSLLARRDKKAGG